MLVEHIFDHNCYVQTSMTPLGVFNAADLIIPV